MKRRGYLMHMGLFFFTLTISSAAQGSVQLWKRRYDQVVFATTHNSTSTTRPPRRTWFVPNQEKGVKHQLAAGIRAFMIDAHLFRGKVWACHAYCELGGVPLSKVLKDFKEFLRINPNEVVTIIFESYVENSLLAQEFLNSGISESIFTKQATQPWPTLWEMVKANRRLVIFSDRNEQSAPWIHHVWDHAVETPFSIARVEEFGCEFNRGNPQNSLFILNHFLTKPLLRRAWARGANRSKVIRNHFWKCLNETKKIPNFVTIDFYLTSEVVKIVKELNQELEILVSLYETK